MISEHLTNPLKGLDLDDAAVVSAATGPLLTELGEDRSLLHRLIEKVPGNEHLCALSEHYDILDKLVLHDAPSGWRLRLHVFLPGYYDRPHNHRWTYSSRILTGHYEHRTGGAENLMPRPRRFPYTRHKPRATGRNTARFVTSEGSRPCVTAPLSSFPRHGTR